MKPDYKLYQWCTRKYAWLVRADATTMSCVGAREKQTYRHTCTLSSTIKSVPVIASTRKGPFSVGASVLTRVVRICTLIKIYGKKAISKGIFK